MSSQAGGETAKEYCNCWCLVKPEADAPYSEFPPGFLEFQIANPQLKNYHDLVFFPPERHAICQALADVPVDSFFVPWLQTKSL